MGLKLSHCFLLVLKHLLTEKLLKSHLFFKFKMSLSFLKQNFVIHEFFQNFNEKQQIKLSKYLCIIAIDYLTKYFKNRQMGFENIKELAGFLSSLLLNFEKIIFSHCEVKI